MHLFPSTSGRVSLRKRLPHGQQEEVKRRGGTGGAGGCVSLQARTIGCFS